MLRALVTAARSGQGKKRKNQQHRRDGLGVVVQSKPLDLGGNGVQLFIPQPVTTTTESVQIVTKVLTLHKFGSGSDTHPGKDSNRGL